MLDEILDDGLVNFLFVGRIAPNKKIEDHIRLAEQYKRYVDAYYRFIFVGRYDVVPQYYATIRALLSEYQMLQERFIFTGPVPDVELAAYYRASQRVHLAERTRRVLRAAWSKPWRWTCRCWPTARRPCRTRSAGRACSSRPRISSMRRSCSACWLSRTARERQILAGQRRRLRDFGDAVIQQRLASVISAFDRKAGLKPCATHNEVRIAFIVQRYGRRFSAAPSITAG